MSRLRVGHLIKSLGRGGAEVLLPHLARASAAQQEVHAGYFLPWKDAMVASLEQAGATVTCFGARSSLGMFRCRGAVERWMLERELDLVHCHLPVSGAVGRLAASAAGIPVVYTEHNLQQRYRVPTRWLNRLTWSRQDRVVAVSEEVARSIALHLPDSVRVDVVRNGIGDLPFLGAVGRGGDFRRRAGLAGVPVVGTVAVFRTQKRLDLWLEVAREVSDEVPEVRFLLVGAGPAHDEIERRAVRLGLADRVVFPGLQTNVVDWLGCMDVFLSTSEFEGLPLALLEAMMVGTPVVATRVGGIPEVIRHTHDGLLTSFGAMREQADHVVALLADEPARQAMATAARTTARERFGIGRMAAELETIYRDVLDQRGVA